MTEKNQNDNISRQLENAAKEIRKGKWGDLMMTDSVQVIAYYGGFKITAKPGSVTPPQPKSNKIFIFGK